MSISSNLVEFDSSGRIVKAAAPKGVCIPTDSIQTGRESAFLLMDDCDLPSKMGGVLSVSIAGAPMTLGPEGLERFFRTEAGIVGLGYGGDIEDVALIEATIGDGAVFAVIEDRSEFGPPFAGDVICRAFTELNGRMAVVTLMSLRDRPEDPAKLSAELKRIVAALRAANA
ncbi:MAG: hypothetical protein AAF360_11960 [Pseudomonadota bacterium]